MYNIMNTKTYYTSDVYYNVVFIRLIKCEKRSLKCNGTLVLFGHAEHRYCNSTDRHALKAKLWLF